MHKIVPSLWFIDNCEEAVNLYVDVFNSAPESKKDSKVIHLERYPENSNIPGGDKMKGKILTAIFELAGQRFMALDGGPGVFEFNPSISFHIKCSTTEEVDHFFKKLSDGGKVLMELDEYPFSKRFSWVQDKYGVSWQIIMVDEEIKQKITPAIMFIGDMCGKAEEAIDFYTSIFKNSKKVMVQHYGKDEKPDKEGTLKYGHFTLEGQEFGAMDSAYDHKFSMGGAVSFLVDCQNQEEVDYFWEKMSANPQAEQCGWIQDKYGIAWQIIPKQLGELLSDKDKAKAKRVMDAMLQMKKIVVADLEKAYNQ